MTEITELRRSLGSDTKYFYPNAWKYREWVVNAFNRDLPYDQFVKAQIAAGQLGEATVYCVAADGDSEPYRFSHRPAFKGRSGVLEEATRVKATIRVRALASRTLMGRRLSLSS